jgi:hypothetical protein
MLRTRFEAALCAVFAILALATLVWPTWIESLTGLEPDGGNGMFEWLIVLVFGLVALGLGLLARHDYRLARSRPVSVVPHGPSRGSPQ